MLITILAHNADHFKDESGATIDYKVEIQVNKETVWRGGIKKHRRGKNNWLGLLGKIQEASRADNSCA